MLNMEQSAGNQPYTKKDPDFFESFSGVGRD